MKNVIILSILCLFALFSCKNQSVVSNKTISKNRLSAKTAQKKQDKAIEKHKIYAIEKQVLKVEKPSVASESAMAILVNENLPKMLKGNAFKSMAIHSSKVEDIIHSDSFTKAISKIHSIQKKSNKHKAEVEGYPVPHPNAFLSLIFGIVSFLFLAIPLTIFPVIALGCAITALVLGSSTLKEMRANPDVFTGRGMAVAGVVLGIVFLSLMLLALLVIILILSTFGY